MKVKEMPVSLFTQAKLSASSANKLIQGKKSIPVVVSLASIPSRLGIVHLTIRSILNQDVLPTKIILWLHEDLKHQIPKKLSSLEGTIFSIHYSNYKSSHRKLVETLKIIPETTVVTCDDDMMYRKDWLSKLYAEHQSNPGTIIGNQTRCISYDSEGKLLPYKAWPFGRGSCSNPDALLPIGAGGTLYPVNVLDAQVFDQDLFMQLTPRADDLWFKAMGLLKGTQSIRATHPGKEPIPIWGSQKVSLKKTNISEDKNRAQWQAVSDYFNLKIQ